jgi:hypothetical protein
MRYAFFTVLPDPSGIPVAGRAKKNVLRELAKLETLFPALINFSHDWILNEKDGKI